MENLKTQKRIIKMAIMAIGSSIIVTSCALAPVNSHYESARSLQKNSLEASATYTRYTVYDEELDFTNQNIGLRLGYGITDKLDLKVEWQNYIPSPDYDLQESSINYFALSPKFTFIQNKLALKVPFSLYNYNIDGDSGQNFAVAPTILATWPFSSTFEAGLAVSYQIGLSGDENVYESNFVGISLGFGLSNDLDIWSIRPEIGYQVFDDDFNTGWLNLGVAFTYNFDLAK